MSEGKNKRIVKKSKNTDKLNIKVSTADKDLLSKDNKININIEGQNKKKLTKINTSQSKTNIEKEESIQNILSKLIEKNNKSLKEIETIKNTISVNEEKELSEIMTLNQKLSTLEKGKIQVTKDNVNLLNQIKGIEEKVNKKFSDKFKMSKIFENLIKNAVKRNINIEIKSKEDQVKNVQKIIKSNQKEIKKLNSLLENNSEDGKQKLNKELKEINDKISILQKEIDELNKIKLEHTLCKKNNNTLRSQLNVLLNDYEYESKKSNMIQSEKKEATKIPNINMTMIYGENVRKNFFKNVKNKYNSKIKIVNYKSYNFLMKELKENKKSYLGSSYDNFKEKNMETMGNSEIPSFSTYLKKHIDHRIDTKSPQIYLFNEQEKEVLKKLIPNEYYNNYNEKYSKVENELTEIGEKFKGNELKKNELYLNSIKYDEINLKKKELDNIKANLSIFISKNNKKILELKKKIQNLNNDIKKQNLIISNKNKNNNLLKKRIDVLKRTKILQAG